jgi:signal peptidase I, archaeal type
MKRKIFSVLKRILLIILTVFLLLMLFINAFTLWSIREIKRGEYVKSGYFCVIIGSGSMKPTMQINDLLLIKGADTYQEGDVITYVSPKGSLVTHRITRVTQNGYITQGDANNIPDNEVSRQRVLGKVAFVVTGIGWIIENLLSPVGIMLLVCIFILILVIQKLQRKTNNENARVTTATKKKETKMRSRRRVGRRKRKILVVKRRRKPAFASLKRAFSTFLTFGLFVFSIALIQGTMGRYVHTVTVSDSAKAAVYDIVITAPEGFTSDTNTYEHYFISKIEVARLNFQVYNGGETDVLCTPHVSNDVKYRVFLDEIEYTHFIIRTNETANFWIFIGPEGLDVSVWDAEIFIDIRQLEGG